MSKIYVQNFPQLLSFSGSLVAAGSISGSLPCAGYSQLVGYITSSGSSETGSGLCVQQSVDSGSNWDINSGSYAVATAFTSSCMLDIIGNAVKVRFAAGATDIDEVRTLFQLKPVAGTAKMPDVDIDVISSGSVTVTSGSLTITAGSINILKSGSVVVTSGCLDAIKTGSFVMTAGSITSISGGSVIVTSGSITNIVFTTTASTALSMVSASTSASGEFIIVSSPATAALRHVVTDFVIQNESGALLGEAITMILRSGSARGSVGDRWRFLGASPGMHLNKSFGVGYEWRLDAGSPVVLYGSSSPVGYSLAYFTETA